MIKHRLGLSFATPIIFFGVIATIAGILVLTENIPIGMTLIVTGAFFWSSSFGSQIDIFNQQFREYSSFYGIKNGKWQPLHSMSCLCIISSRQRLTYISRSNSSISYLDHTFQVCLLNKTHRKRIIIKNFESREKAEVYARKLANVIKKDFVTFNPKLSEKTKKRKMEASRSLRG